MKQQTVTLKVFEEGDYVITPDGFGIIRGIDFYVSKFNDLYYKVHVQHKEGYSENPDNDLVMMDGGVPSLITKAQYDCEMIE